MVRLGGRLLLLLLVLGVVCAPAFVTDDSSAPAPSEPTRITSYDVDYTVNDDGDLYAVETVTVDFPSYPERRGIFRFWDTWDPAATFKRRVPHDIEVTQDGSPAEVARYTESGGRQHVARVGSEYSTISPGVHTYVIRYTIRGVVEPGQEAARSQFYWNVVPQGWAQEIDRATVTVSLPTDAAGVQCAVGQGSTGGCRVSGDGSDELRITVDDLPARTPVTIKAGLEMATPETGETRRWPYQWDSVFGSSVPGVLAVVALAVLAGWFGWRRERDARESAPGFPLQYAPPDGIGPAQAAYILTEGVPRTALVATLLHISESRLADLERGEDGWTLQNRAEASQWSRTDEVTREVGAALLEGSSSFTARPGDAGSGHRLRDAVATVKQDALAWAAREGHMVPSGLGTSGGAAVLVALAATVLLVIFNPFSMTLVALIPGLFAVGALFLVVKGSGTKRTASGRDLWSRLGGFRRVLSTPSSEDRFDFSGRRELYTAYIPWAVAFGVAEEWARKYRTEVGEEPPVPAYFGGYYGYSTGAYVDAMVNDFDSTIQSSISSYEASIAPQSSGSSGFSSWSGGGGGFGGGFGGGGGGGGSW